MFLDLDQRLTFNDKMELSIISILNIIFIPTLNYLKDSILDKVYKKYQRDFQSFYDKSTKNHCYTLKSRILVHTKFYSDQQVYDS